MSTWRTVGALITLTLLVVAGCGGPAGEQPAAGELELEPAELTVWHAYRGAEKEAFEQVVQTFNAKMADIGVSVKTLAVPYDAYADKISAAVPRGKGPDVFIFAQDRLGGWVETGNIIEPIDFFLDEGIADRFLPSTMDAMVYQGTTYGLPLNYKCITQIYNKALVQDPPETSGELVRLAQQLTNAKTGQYGLAYTYADFYYHAALMNGFGGGVFDEERSPTLNSPENVESLELMMRWFEQDGILPAEPSTALVTSLFNAGKAAIVFSGPWFLGEIADDIEFGLAPLPTLDEAGGAPMRPWMTVEGVYIAAPSDYKDQAYAFVEYVTSADAGLVMAKQGGQTPANEAVYDDQEVATDPILSAFREQVETAVPMPNYAEMSMVWSPATTSMNMITRKTATPKQALDVAQEEVVQAVSRLRAGE
jgi:arabinogalactan oligomer/maltooligosaccharide transport system substrate-binding protein